jgi:hypothetical protein
MRQVATLRSGQKLQVTHTPRTFNLFNFSTGDPGRWGMTPFMKEDSQELEWFQDGAPMEQAMDKQAVEKVQGNENVFASIAACLKCPIRRRSHRLSVNVHHHNKSTTFAIWSGTKNKNNSTNDIDMGSPPQERKVAEMSRSA